MILSFADWRLSPNSGTLGYQFDNLTRELVVQGDLPEGWEWDVLVSAGGNDDIWPLTLGDGRAYATLTDDNLSVSGEYYLQLRGTQGKLVRHTNIVTAHNFRSLSGAGKWPTYPTEWIQAEKDIKELNSHPPVPGEDGYWQLWDLTTHSYQPSQLVVPGLSIQAGTVTTLAPGDPATAEVVGEGPDYILNLGIPRGEDGVQINDEAVNTTETWSSKKLLDTLCPPFTETGNPITCHPVEDYPLDVTVTMEPIQEGTGDPSPENVRPISGRNNVKVTVSNETENHDYTLTMPETIYGGEVDAVSGVGSKEWKYIELSGIETFSLGNIDQSDTVQQFNMNIASFPSQPNRPCFCNVLPANRSVLSGLEIGIWTYVNTTVILCFSRAKLTDYGFVAGNTQTYIAAFRAYLAAQYSAGTPVTICYKLATPEPFQATGNQPIPALAGENTVYTDGDSLTVSGRTDPLSTIQTMQAQITALQDQVTQGGTA